MAQDDTTALQHVRCALCGNDDTDHIISGTDRMLGSRKRFAIVKCRACGFMYTNPRPAASSLAEYYPKNYAPYSMLYEERAAVFNRNPGLMARLKNGLKREFLTRILGYPGDFLDARIRSSGGVPPAFPMLFAPCMYFAIMVFRESYYRIPHWKPEGTVLDIGCGSGEYLLTLKNLGWNVVGFDIDNQVNREDIPVITGDLARVAQRSQSRFDVITMWHSLEHVNNPLETLQYLHTMINDDGEVLIEVPDNANIIRRIFGKDWIHWDLPRHLSHFTLNTLRHALEKTGFAILDARHLCTNGMVHSVSCFQESHPALPQMNVKDSLFVRKTAGNIGRLLALFHNTDIIFVRARKR